MIDKTNCENRKLFFGKIELRVLKLIIDRAVINKQQKKNRFVPLWYPGENIITKDDIHPTTKITRFCLLIFNFDLNI